MSFRLITCFIIAKNYRVLKLILLEVVVPVGFIIAKNYRVLKREEVADKVVEGFIIAKNYRVLKLSLKLLKAT